MNVIRWRALIYIMVCLAITVNLQAQENRAFLQKQVRITHTLLSIDSLSSLITAHTGVFLSFNSNKIAPGKKIVTQKRLYAVAELLELIKSNTGSSYRIYEDHVIFHKQYKVAGGVKQTTLPANKTKTSPIAKVKTASPDKIKAPLNEIKATTAKETKPPISEAKSSRHETTAANETKAKLTIEPIKVKARLLLKPPITLLQKPGFTAQPPTTTPLRISQTRWFADGGFTMDEVLYLNPYISAGHKYLHGFFSWSSSFKVSGFRYGLGSMVSLNNDWRIGLMVTTGKLNRNIDFTGIRDTAKNVTVKSELHRLAIQVEKDLKPHLVVKAGPVFNLLKSSYFQDGTPVTVATSGYEGTNGDREIYTVRPLYTLSNSYKATEPTNTKTWIGFQVSLCYRFHF